MSSYRLGLLGSTLILLAWVFIVHDLDGTMGGAGSLVCLPVSFICAAAIIFVLVASREALPDPAGLALRVIGFAVGFSLGHSAVDWLTQQAALRSGAGVPLRHALSPLVYVPVGLVGPVVTGLWGAYLFGLVERTAPAPAPAAPAPAPPSRG